MTGIMRRVDPDRESLYLSRADACVHDIFQYHVKPELGCTLDNVALDGTARLNYTEGRMVKYKKLKQ